MLRFLADEDFNHDILRGLRRRKPDLDLVRVQDVGLTGADDPTALAWAAAQGCIVLTHDVAATTHFAYARVRAAQPMPGVFEVHRRQAITMVIEDLPLLAEYSEEQACLHAGDLLIRWHNVVSCCTLLICTTPALDTRAARCDNVRVAAPRGARRRARLSTSGGSVSPLVGLPARVHGGVG